MALTPGTRLGVYDITAPIGEGGMGQVFRARDTKLDRDVAIKVLPEAFAHDSDRLARFTREAKTLASLNHPHIAAIYGLEESGGVSALVMELVEGEDLSQRIARGAISLDEALPIAKQIAEALEAAHEQGIIHRDLKPANIKVRSDGTVKVLDFGLAKALEPAAGLSPSLSMSPTIMSPAQMSGVGVLLGTAAYMSPEQAKGRPVDRRADVWAFGAVLYEMVTGASAFAGDSVMDVMASVLTRDPDWSKLPADTPVINSVIRRCLERDPRQRVGDMQSVRVALTGAFAAAPTTTTTTAARGSSTWATMVAWGVAISATVTALALSALYVSRPTGDQPVIKSSILPPPNVAFDFDTTVGPAVISPDGKLIAFSGRDATNRIQLWVRPIDSTEARSLAGTDGASFPFWSPNSQALGFYSAARGRLERVDLAGGAPIVIAIASFVRGACWTKDGAVLYDTSDDGGRIHEVPIAGGTPRSVVGENGAARSPSMLPDDRHFLYANRGQRQIHVVARDGTGDKVLTDSTSHAIYADGYLLFMRERALLAQKFDLASLALSGSATAIARDVQTVLGDSRGVFSTSENGRLIYLDSGDTRSTLAWFDANGKRVGTVNNLGGARGVRLSPDGRTAAIALLGDEGGDDGSGQTIWTIDLATNTPAQLTFKEESAGTFVSWSPDGRRLAYSARRNGAYVIAERSATGGTEQLIFALPPDQSSIGAPRLTAWTNDGSTLLYSGSSVGGVFGLPLATGPSGVRTPQQLIKNRAQNVRLMPNERWVAYQGAADSGPFPQIFVEAYPGGGRRQQVSPRGSLPVWARDGSALYFAVDDILTVVSVTEADGALRFGPPRPIMPIIVGRGYSYDVAKDGRILAIVTSDAQAARPLTLVQNWAATKSRQ